MSQLTLAQTDIDDIEPLNDRDTECLVEIREVLKKHRKLDRFGVALLHCHFEVASDEILLESTDEEARTLTITPVKHSDAGSNNVGTIWMLREGEISTMSWCRQYCKWKTWGGHRKAHNKVPGN